MGDTSVSPDERQNVLKTATSPHIRAGHFI
jgi:hypothetical protein